ncbi:aspartate/glutamate racemase family protein [uncultured Methylobacterium sp.]|uniref:maleate cis-trans isomerase family protein n=1 Tax=uncultured Methylobacterium sp. TaxID=157278 RepID=UPI0035CA0D50
MNDSPPAGRKTRIGHITPSSNTVLEPLTYAMNRACNDRFSHHFSRVQVTHLALSPSSELQFQLQAMTASARLLNHAAPDCIVWNGTSASWRGVESDIALCEAITTETGLPASTSTLAFYNAYKSRGWSKIGLALPYTEDVSRKIRTEYERQGFEITAASSLGLRDNLEIGNASPEQIRTVLREASEGAPDCIAVVCTNFNATDLIEEMEGELGIPIVDSIAVTFWEAARIAGVDLKIDGWGRFLASVA